MSGFFGKLSPFEILTAIVAFVTAIWTLYREIFQRARLAVYSGNSASLVIHGDSHEPSQFVISGAFANSGAVLGVVTDVAANMTDPDGGKHEYAWIRSVDPRQPDSLTVTHSPATAIAIPAHESRPFHIVLQHTAPERDSEWVLTGTYRVVVSVWCNRKRPKSPNAVTNIEFDISDIDEFLASAGQRRVLVVSVRR